MPHEAMQAAGEVVDIFGHRFVVRTAEGKILADLTPKGAEQVALKAGDRVELAGERKPTELKVHTIALNGGRPVAIDHPPKPHPHGPEHGHAPVDPRAALKTAEANGFTILGEPRRKPKHFEILGRDAAGDAVELHIELDGRLRKTRPVADGDPKWGRELAGIG